MPYRDFDTGFWTDSFVQELPGDAKILFIYLWTNEHCNAAGLYQITPATIAFETSIPQERLSTLLPLLKPKVIWYKAENLIWVKNFLRRQAKSSKFIVSAIKSLNGLRIPEDIRNSFESYNEELLRGVTLSEHLGPTKRECVIIRDDFRCQYCGKEINTAGDYEMDHIIPITRGGKDNYMNLVAACRSCNQKKLDKTPSEAGMTTPSPAPFHGAQATYILRNTETTRNKWLRVFPDRYKVIETLLFNIGQYCGKLPSVAASVTDAVTGLNKEPGVVRGEIETGEAAPRSRTEIGETLCEGDRVVIPAHQLTQVELEGVRGTKSPVKGQIPTSKSEAEENLSPGDQAVISTWRSVKGFDMAPADASELVTRLRKEFTGVDILAESKKWAARKLSEPLTKKSRPSQQIWNWMLKEREFAEERRAKGGKYQRHLGTNDAKPHKWQELPEDADFSH